MFRGLAAIVLVGACAAVSNGTAPDPSSLLDEKVFRCNVEPILVRQCSYNACHGIAGTSGQGAALRVYTPGKLRATQPADFNALVAPLTEDEHHANFESASGFAWNTATVEDNFLLRKPLPSSQGGYEHIGGPIWSSTTDSNYVAIHDWLAGTAKCP